MLIARRLALALLIFAASFAVARAQTTKITFLLVNDIYQMSEQVLPDGKTRGGFARLAAIVKAERAKGGHVIFAHAGDTLSPSLMSSFDRGEHIITLTNMVPPDVFVPGNHEYDYGREIFLKRMSEARFPRYAANLRGPDGHPLPDFKDRNVIEFDGVRIGLTGATGDDSPAKSNPQDLKIVPTVETVTAQAAALRAEGADFVVAVVHANRTEDRELYARRAADLILTGDDHDLYIAYDGRTAMVESSSDAHYVTAIDVTIAVSMDEGRRQIAWWPQFRVIDSATVEPDPAVAAEVKKYEQELSRELDVEIGRTAVDLDSRNATVRTREAAIGSLIADAIRASAGTDVALTNGGGIRANKRYAAGALITRRDVLSELPFGNRVVTLRVTGKALKEAIENGLGVLPLTAGRFPHISGMSVKADLSRPPGQRVRDIRIGGAPLDDARRYTLATNDFLARGSDGYTMFRDAEHLTRDYDGPLMANEVMAHVRRLGTIHSTVDGRMTVK
jgi:2',3'-cyclic-nucleotide 2'-phosphodiesterase (5'-nucleotidase family)